MKQRFWVHVVTAVVLLGLSAGLLGVGYRLFLLVGDLFATSEEFDGVGIILGLLVLALASPLVVSMVVLLRRSRRPDPAPGLVGAGATCVFLLLLGLLWVPLPFTWWVVLVAVVGVVMPWSTARITRRS